MAGLEDTTSSTDLQDSSSSGNTLEKYIIEGPIGKGGFGEVYKAQHRYLGNYVAIKFLRPEHQDEKLAGLLVREAQVLTKLGHRNIVRVWDLDIDANDRIYLIMEYMDDGNLTVLLESAAGPLPVEEVAQVISQVANGLNHIHQYHMIHRDLKPQNILRDKSGRIVIADFGLAKILDNVRSQTSQSSGLARAGTPQYMAPEHFDGKAEYRSDLYSLGVIAYQLFTGHLPFTSNYEEGHRRKNPPPLREFNSRLTPEIEQVVLNMLEKAPEKRYRTALDFARALDRTITQKTLRAMRTDPEHFHEHLENIAEGRVMSLGPGNYLGPFTLDKRLHLIGAGQSTKLYTVDQPALHIHTSGVQLENMVIQRTHESDDEAVIQADEQVSYTLRQVTIQGGRAEWASWEDAEWQLPVGGIDFGRIPVESQQSREVQIEVKEWCTLTVSRNLPGLEVFPTRLSPGPHTLKLEFNADGCLPSTHLDGSVRLQGESESREIQVTGQLEQPVLPPAPASIPAEERSLTSMEWVYQLWDEAAQGLLSKLGESEGKKLAAQWEKDKGDQKLKRQMRDRALDLLFDLVGRKACLWYVRRLRVNEKKQHSDEEIWELILAIDGPNFPSILSKRKKTLRLECRIMRDGTGTLKVSDISVLNQNEGVENLVALPALVRLALRIPDFEGIPAEFIVQIQDLPIKSAEKLDIDQLRGWQDLLHFQSDQIKKRQYWVGYIRHNYREGASKVTFFLDKDNTRNGIQELITYEEFQKLAGKSRREQLKIFETLPPTSKAQKRRDQVTIGSVERFHPEAGRLEIKLEQKMTARIKNGKYDLPLQGYLHFDAGGDMSQNERHRNALSTLEQGRATNPLLGDFFFDARKARPIEAIQQLLPADLLSGTCNGGQIAAIEAALATRDLLLIQGPPGTGKTTVIAEICYQVALHGGRTLIASQSNLAVDNALGRIIHHPRVRALRKGNSETVEDEGRDYTEEYVAQKWLSNTANDCQAKLKKRQENIELFRRLLGVTGRFAQYRAGEVTWENMRLSFQRKHAAIDWKIHEITTSILHDEGEKKKYTSVQQILPALLAGEVVWSRPEPSGVLQDTFHYLFADTADKTRFISQVDDGLQIVEQVGLTPPAGGHVLMHLVWLKETAHTHNAAWAISRQLIDQTGEEIARMNEMSQLLENLTSSIQDKKGQAQDLTTQIDALQTSLEHLTCEMDRLRRATAALNMLPQNGAGNIASILQAFLTAELSQPSVGARQFAPLEIGMVFPQEIMTVIQENTSAAFLGMWRSAEKAIQGNIRKTISERNEYRQMCDKLSLWGRSFSWELSHFPDINYELGRMRPEGYIPIPQDTATFSHLVNQIENNLRRIDETRITPPSIIARFFREQEKQRVLKLFLETRELLIAADEGQNSIHRHIHESHVTFSANIAEWLSSSLREWLSEQQGKARNTHRVALLEKERLETERQQIQRRCHEEEAQLAEARRTCDVSTQRLTGIFQELCRCASIPEALRKGAQQNVNSTTNALSFVDQYRTLSQSWVSDVQRLEMLVNELWSELQTAGGKIQQRLAQIHGELEQQRSRLSELRSEWETFEGLLQHDPSALLAERQWWRDFWETIPEHLGPLVPPEGIFALPFLEAVEKQFTSWKLELAKEEVVADRYDRLVADWVTRLRNLSEDETRELQKIYIKNANVIGITCGQAPKLSFEEERTFASFDTIIIDEVSKATAPELLLPAIKGKRLILIGDQHQLPPMIEDKTLVQMAEESEKDPQEYRFLNRSYFKERYNEAPEAIKRMLSIQYRMHPDIMAAINQFYEHPLECGLNQPDVERDHQLESALVRKNKHLIWVTTPLVSEKQRSRMILIRNKATGREVFRYRSPSNSFGDEAEGTSYRNHREVEIIEKICEEFQRIWALKKATGAEPKEIGVITFYAAQEKLLRDCLLSRNGKSSRFGALNIRIGTVDRFQGMERAIIIVSMVRNNSDRDIGFARKDERINVAFSRAQELLVIVGCQDLFCGTARYEEAVERYNNVSKIVKKRGDFIDVSCI